MAIYYNFNGESARILPSSISGRNSNPALQISKILYILDIKVGEILENYIKSL